MKRLFFGVLALVVLGLLICVVVNFGHGSARKSGNSAGNNEGWLMVINPGATSSTPQSCICTNADCGFEALLRIWHALDSAHSVYEAAAPGIAKKQIDEILTASSRNYPRSLPVLHGALEAHDLQFQDYLAMRSSVAKAIAGDTNVNCKAFVYSVKQQNDAMRDFFQQRAVSGKRSLKFTDAACRDLLLEYLRSGLHTSADEEHWIGVDGPSRLAMFGAGTSNQTRSAEGAAGP